MILALLLPPHKYEKEHSINIKHTFPEQEELSQVKLTSNPPIPNRSSTITISYSVTLSRPHNKTLKQEPNLSNIIKIISLILV